MAGNSGEVCQHGLNETAPRDGDVKRVGELATRIWIDPGNVNGVEYKGSPEKLVARYDVLATVPNEAGGVLVAYVAGRVIQRSSFNPDEADNFLAELYEREVQGVPLTFHDDERASASVVVHQERQKDGSLQVAFVCNPNVQTVVVGGPDDKGRYRLEDDKSGALHLELYKLVDRTSLFERERLDAVEYMAGVDPDIMSTLYEDTTNFGAGILGPGRGGNGEFAALPTTPGKDGMKVRPHEISTGMSK